MPVSPPFHVVQLIPWNGIGGVESAARSCPSGQYGTFQFTKYFLASRSDIFTHDPADVVGAFPSDYDPRNILRALAWLYRSRPDLVIASLWRSYIVLIAYKILRPFANTVCFLHSDRSVHFIDFVSALVSMVISNEIWVDSQQTLQARVLPSLHCKTRVLSFLLCSNQPVTPVIPSPLFLFWGRISREKNLRQAISIVAALKQHFDDVRYLIIGPDRGELPALLRMVHRLGLGANVFFLGPKSFDDIRCLASTASFYLQTSIYEGMAISVIEAMQLGLVPAVTPVGEIPSYCTDGLNSILVNQSSPAALAARLTLLINDPSRYASMRSSAFQAWIHANTYRDDFIARCHSLVSSVCISR